MNRGGRPDDRGRRVGRVFRAAWLVYLALVLVDQLTKGYSVGQQILGVVGCAAFSRLYLTTELSYGPENEFDPKRENRVAALRLAAMATIAGALTAVADPEWFAMWVYVSACCGLVLPYERRNLALVGGAAATTLMVLQCVLAGLPFDGWGWVLPPSLFACLGTLAIRRMRNLISELEQAREEVSQLARNEERLRLARDLHDLAGHSLATITLKAELARRLLAENPLGAEKQLTDIETVSRTALADIREAVSGYRRPTLAVEAASARTALGAAGVIFDADPLLPIRSGTFDPDAEAALAWCLREAVTNVIRHAHASRCAVRLVEARTDGETSLTLEVTDDGQAKPTNTDLASADLTNAGQTSTDPTSTDPTSTGLTSTGLADPCPEPAWGNGLTGLRERLAPFHATLRAEPVRPHGFRLSATMPLGLK